MSTYLEEYKRKLISAERAVLLVKSGDIIEYGMFAIKPIDFDIDLGQRWVREVAIKVADF